MAAISRKRVLRVSFWFGIAFIFLFLLRLAYGYIPAGPHRGFNSDNSSDYFSGLTNLRKNYATEKAKQDQSFSSPELVAAQKYEKTATVKSGTSHFEEDETRIRKTTEGFGGSIQYEQSMGRQGGRELYLSIGVKPASFDSFYREVQAIGELKATSITKIDKTNEYRQLNAKKASLEKTLASLNELKSRGGAISDFVDLNEKIQELEGQVQELGIDLGNYNTENEFCTLHFSLIEGREAVHRIGFASRVKVALEWTIKYYCLSVVALFGVLLCSLLGLMIFEKLAGWTERGPKQTGI